ncbi:MAG TPA: hypothetical protein VFM29_04520 [Vicinamibacteria bacterium]|nr:hypothetical protein [Vicinamibacteria bacterium]
MAGILATVAAVAANVGVVVVAIMLRPRFATDGVVRMLLVLYAAVNLLALARTATRERLWEAGFRVTRIAFLTNVVLGLSGLVLATASFTGPRATDAALPFLLPLPALLTLAALYLRRERRHQPR